MNTSDSARPRQRRRDDLTADYTELAQQVRLQGLLRRRYGYYWTKLLAVPVVVGLCCALFIALGDTWWQMATAVLFAVVLTQVAFLGHDAAHRQIFQSGKWNDWVTILIGDLVVGMSYGWWQHKHSRHHANPNREGADPDLELPVVAFTPGKVARVRNPVIRWLLAHQGIYFFPLLLLEGLSLHASSVRRVFSPAPLARRWVEAGLLTLRFGGYLALIFSVLSPGKAAAFLAVQLGVFGFYMGMSFAPNHKGMPLVPKEVRLDFLRRQVLTSRNIRGSRLLDVAMGGLNYQIEHHLFPSMPRPHLRTAARIVREYCQRKGVPYTQTGLLESYRIVVRHINRVGLGERDPFACPLIAQRQAL